MCKFSILSIFIMSFFSFSMHVFAHDYAMSYLFGGTTTQYNKYVSNTGNVLDSVSPDYFEINPNGSLSHPKIDINFIHDMHYQNKQVIPFISNHWDRDLGIAALNNTEALTTQIANTVSAYSLDGINVDIENVSHLHKDAYTNFVKRLREKMPDKVITVAVAANPNNWQTGWHGSYDYANLANYSDYLVIMGYDESFYGGPAGPVASASFTERSILYALQHTTGDKLVLGVPFFGRFWKQGEAVGGSGLTKIDVENFINNYHTTKVYHSDTQSAQLTLTLNEGEVMPKLWGGKILTPGVYDIWYDDEPATIYKLDLVEKYNLKGSGSWALGQETADLWSPYASYKTANQEGVPAIKYSSHIQDVGWEADLSRRNGATSGTQGRLLRMEAIKCLLQNFPEGASISYQAHVQDVGWQPWVNDGAIAGTAARSLRVEAIRMQLNNMSGYHVEYRTHVQDVGWQPWVRDGAIAGTTGRSLRMEAIQIRIVPDIVVTTALSHSDIDSKDIVDKGWFSKEEYDANAIVTRADAIKMIMRMAINLPELTEGVQDFNDTKNHPDKKFIQKARYYGIVIGDGDNNFYPDYPVTKKILVLMLDRVFNLPDTVDFDNNIAHDIVKIGDGESFYAINKYLEHEIVSVDGEGDFHPNDPITMAELVRIAERLDGVGIKELKPIIYEGQQQNQKILEPR